MFWSSTALRDALCDDLARYCEDGHPGTTQAADQKPPYTPAPPACHRPRGAFPLESSAKGPLGLLLLALHRVGAALAPDFRVATKGALPFSLVTAPWQYVAKATVALGRAARDWVAAGSRASLT
eukprot:729999-Alexandrium_andersonii.AAC.1